MVGISETSRQELRDMLKEHQLMDYADDIEDLAEGYVYLTLTDEDTYQQVGNTRIGGVPDLPTTIEWAKTDNGYMSFLAQINLAELPQLPDSPLPEHGMLYFFHEYDASFSGKHHVSYSDSMKNELRKSNNLANGTQVSYSPFSVKISDSYYLPDSLEKANTLADFANLGMKLNEANFQHWLIDIWNPFASKFFDWYYDKTDNPDVSMILGQHSFLRPYLLHEAERVRLQKSYSYKPSQVDLKYWIILLQLGSHEKSNMVWHDAGFFDFAIHTDDLAKRDFSKTFAAIVSS
ncbi:MAG: YwqG family protein [Chloroflexota bacterium]